MPVSALRSVGALRAIAYPILGELDFPKVLLGRMPRRTE